MNIFWRNLEVRSFKNGGNLASRKKLFNYYGTCSTNVVSEFILVRTISVGVNNLRVSFLLRNLMKYEWGITHFLETWFGSKSGNLNYGLK